MSANPKNPAKLIEKQPSNMKSRREHVQGSWVETLETVAQSSRPADFTFMKMRTLQTADPEDASSGRMGLLAAGPENRLLTRGLWLSNNKLTSVQNLPKLAYSVLEFPALLGFLDLSCNRIVDIHDDLFSFPHLSILYLHGNRINDPTCIFKLRKLKKLHHLTLYGNPICHRIDLGHIRNLVTWYLPNLQKLDHNRITKQERNTPLSTYSLKILRRLQGNEDVDWLFEKFPKPKLTMQQLQKCGLAPIDRIDEDGTEDASSQSTCKVRMHRIAQKMIRQGNAQNN